MKTVSSFTETKIDNPSVVPIWLVKMEFSGGLTLYLCSRVFGVKGSICTFNDQLYEPFVVSFGSVNQGRIDPITYKPEISEASFTVFNGIPVGGYDTFSDLLSAKAPHYAVVTITEIQNGASASGDGENIFKGSVEDFSNMSKDMLSIRCSGIDGELDNQYSFDEVDADTYSNAHPDDIGKMLPQVYGSAKNVPLMAVNAGWATKLAEEMDDSETGNIQFTDVTGFDSSGTVRVGSEEMTYSSKSDTNNTLNISARAQNSTTAVAHYSGDNASQVQSYYDYILGHPVKDIKNIKIDKILQTSGVTAYTGQSGDQHPGYSNKGGVRLTVNPFLIKQRQFVMDEGEHSHGEYHYDLLTPEIITDYGITYGAANIGARENLYGWNVDEIYLAAGAGVTRRAYVEYGFVQTQQRSGTPYQWRMIVVASKYAASGTVTLYSGQFGGNAFISYETLSTDWEVYASGWTSCAYTWAQISAMEFYLELSVAAGADFNQALVRQMAMEIKVSEESSEATDIGVSNDSSADIILSGKVTADIDGWQDDGSGTYTGTPNALIERPDHISKHIIINRCGKTSSEIDATSYAASGTFYNTNSMVLGFAILQKPNPRRLLYDVAYQSKSLQFWEAGVHHLVAIPSSDSTDKEIDSNRIDLNQIYPSWTPRVAIKNKISAFYHRDWSGYEDDETAHRAQVSDSDATSISKYGTLQGPPESWPYITTSGHADIMIAWRLLVLKDVRIVIIFTGGYYLTDIERGDVLEFTEGDVVGYITKSARLLTRNGDYILSRAGDYINWRDVDAESADTFLQDALLGLVTLDSHQFRVIDVNRIYESAAIQIEVIKI